VRLALVAAAGLALAGPAQAQSPAQTSVYSTLEAEACRTLEQSDEGAGWIVQRCPGPGGWALKLVEDDLRQSLSVLTPRGGEYALDFYTLVSSGFSRMGPRAEWRGRTVKGRFQPQALIVRYTANPNGEDAVDTTSWLVVARIDPEGACITDRVPPGRDQNLRARRLADARRACLQP
jgi:hypothetical protein